MKAPHRSEVLDRFILYSSLWHCDLDALGYAIVCIDIDDAGALALGGDLAST